MSDIGNAETPVVEKTTRLQEMAYSLVGSITADNPIRVYKPKIGFREFSLSEAQKRSIDFIKKNATPKEAIDLIFKNPPPVFIDEANPNISEEAYKTANFLRNQGAPEDEIDRLVGVGNANPDDIKISFIKPNKRTIVINPSSRDIKMSEMETTIPDGLDPAAREYLQLFIKNCKLFMKTPRVRDGFGFSKEDHAKRRLWEEGIMDVFYIISKDWGDAFKNAVDSNRYSKNRRTTLVSFPPYFRDLPLPEKLRQKIDFMEKRFAVAQQMATSGNADAAANILSAESASLIRFFAKPTVV